MEMLNGYKVKEVFISKNEDKTELVVNVVVEIFNILREYIRITTKDIIPFLENEKNIKVEECIASSVISNTSEDSLCGTWVFKLPKTKDKEETIIDISAIEISEKKKRKYSLKKE